MINISFQLKMINNIVKKVRVSLTLTLFYYFDIFMINMFRNQLLQDQL